LPAAVTTSRSLELAGLPATQRLAESLAAVLRPGDVLGLDGDLGAGKTTFVRFLARALGVTAPVTSPTFTLAQIYEVTATEPGGPLLIHHIDAYRLGGDADAEDLALPELLDSGGIVVVEWAERLTLPADRRDLPGLAQGYAHASSELFGTPLEIVADGRMVVHPLQEWTGGGLVNNPQALVRWAKLLYEGDAISGDDLPQLLEIGFPTDSTKPHLGYGLGVYVDEGEHGLIYGHGGFFPGYNSLVAYYPDHGVAVAIQINSDDSQMDRHLLRLADVVIAGLAGAGH
jgi:tRNA threonylcarbamoyl adenosine modification protein YjeE